MQAIDHVALFSINVVRRAFDWVTGYGPNMTEALWLRRIIFLETVAGKFSGVQGTAVLLWKVHTYDLSSVTVSSVLRLVV